MHLSTNKCAKVNYCIYAKKIKRKSINLKKEIIMSIDNKNTQENIEIARSNDSNSADGMLSQTEILGVKKKKKSKKSKKKPLFKKHYYFVR